jgi:hypothetical protein
VALAAERLTTQPVPEFVNDLHDAERDPHVQNRVQREELVVRGQLCVERVEVQGDVEHRGAHQPDAEHEEPRREDPRQVAVHPREQPVRVEDRQLQVQDVAERGEAAHAALLGAALEQVGRRARLLVLHQPGRDQLAREALQILRFEPHRFELVLEPLLHFLHRVPAVEQAEHEVLFAAEPVVLEAHRVLHDVIHAALVPLLVHLQVRPHAQAHLLAPLGRVVQVRGEVHRLRVWFLVFGVWLSAPVRRALEPPTTPTSHSRYFTGMMTVAAFWSRNLSSKLLISTRTVTYRVSVESMFTTVAA